MENYMVGDVLARVVGEGELQFGRIFDEHELLDENWELTRSKLYKVVWNTNMGQVTIINYDPYQERNLQVIDRKHSEGEDVIHAVNEGVFGSILESVTLATIFIPEGNCLLEDVPLDLLTPASLSNEIIFFEGWIGRVEHVVYKVIIEYPDGISGEMNMHQKISSTRSHGFNTVTKVYPPYEGVIVIPTPEEFKTTKWLGRGLLDSFTDLSLKFKDKEGKVKNRTLTAVFVNWMCPHDPNSNSPKPSDTIEQDQLMNIVDFDIKSKELLKPTTFCKYTIRKADVPIAEEAYLDWFSEKVCRQQELNDEAEVGGKRVKKFEERPQTVLQSGTSHFVEIVRIHHAYKVRWYPRENLHHEERLEVGEDLVPFSEQKFAKPYAREFVLPKHEPWPVKHVHSKGRVFGVTQNRQLKNQVITVDFYEFGGLQSYAFLNRVDVSQFELKPHPYFGSLKEGAIVSKKAADGTSCIGMVARVNDRGLVEVHFGKYKCGSGHLEKCTPMELEVIILEKTLETEDMDLSEPTSPPIDSQLDFIQSVSKDLEEFVKSQQNDIRIRPKVQGNINSLTVLMTGPKGTPYENGLFVFGVELSPEYPNIAPRIKLESIPPSGAFLSYDLCGEENWTLKHSRFENCEPLPSKENRLGWSRKVSLLDLLKEIREDIFVPEPYLNKAEHRGRENKSDLSNDRQLLAETITANSEAVVTTVDLLLQLYHDASNSLWGDEIDEHFHAVVPFFRSSFKTWILSRSNVYDNPANFPRFFLYPLSSGFAASLSRRMNELDIASPEDHE